MARGVGPEGGPVSRRPHLARRSGIDCSPISRGDYPVLTPRGGCIDLAAKLQLRPEQGLRIVNAPVGFALDVPTSGGAVEHGLVVFAGSAADVAAHRATIRISVAILRSRLEEADGERHRAQQYLGEAVRLAAPAGYVRRFVEDGRDLSHLLPAVRSIHPAFVDSLTKAIRNEPAAPLHRPTGMWRAESDFC